MKKCFVCLISIFLVFNIISSSSYTYASDNTSDKIIYLTFDDGPGGKTTTDVLDILNKKNVRATFFVIGNQIEGQEDIIKRIVNDGHSLGLHSMSHNKCLLYSSNETFMCEMSELQTLLKELTNEDVTILRFPFGANNSTYKLQHSLVDLIHEKGLKIYDWNVDSTDGANPYADPYTIFKRATTVDESTSPIILLMHCGYINKNSAIALNDIIDYYLDRGYTFKPITSDTEEFYKFMN